MQFHYSIFPSPLSIPAAEFPTPFSASLRRRRQSVHFTRISPPLPLQLFAKLAYVENRDGRGGFCGGVVLSLSRIGTEEEKEIF